MKLTLNEMFNQLEYVYDGHIPNPIVESIKNEFNKYQIQLIYKVMYYLNDTKQFIRNLNLKERLKCQFVIEHKGNLTNEQFEKYLYTLPLDNELFSYIRY